MKGFGSVWLSAFLLFFGSVHAEGDLPAGAVARLGTHHFALLDTIQALSFSPDGNSILGQSSDQAALWDVATAKLKQSQELPDNRTAVFKPEDSSLALIKFDSDWQYLWGFRSHATEWVDLNPSFIRSVTDGEHRSDLAALALSLDGKSLALALHDKTMRIYDVTGKSDPVTLEGHKGFKEWLNFSPDGKHLAGSCEVPVGPGRHRTMLRIWDAGTGRKVHDIGGDFNDGDYSPDGKFIASCGLGFVDIYDAVTLERVRRLVAPNEHTNQVAFSPDGKRLATAQGNRIRLWDTRTWNEVHPASAHNEKVKAIAFSPDGRTIFTGGQDGRLIQWDWPEATERSRTEPVGSSWGIDHLSCSPDGRYLGVTALINHDHPFSVMNANTWEVLSRFGKDNRGRTRIVFRKDGRELLTGQHDGSIATWESATGKLIRKVGHHRDGILAVAIPDPSSQSAWWAGGYQGLGLRDLRTGEDLKILKGGHHHAFADLEMSSNNRYLAVSGELWDLKTDEHLLEYYNSSTSAFSPDSRLFAIGMGDHIQIWEALSQSIIHKIGIGAGDAFQLEFSPDGTVLAAAGDGSTLIWDMTGILQNRTLPELQLTANEMEMLWQSLGSEEEAWAAHLAAWKFSAAGKTAVRFIRERLLPAAIPDPDRVEKLRGKFTDADYDVRDRAARELLDLGIRLKPEERKALGRPLPDYGSIVEFGREKKVYYGPPPKLFPLPDRLRSSRAIKALEYSNTPSSARGLLKELSAGDPDSPQTQEAQSTLASMQK